MIDIHVHVLPALDDGPETMEESLEFCRIAERDGIKTIVATPHVKDGIYDVKSEDIIRTVDALNQQLKENQIDIVVLPGSEIHIYEGLVEGVKSGELITVNNSGRFILFELPFSFVPPGTDNFIYTLRLNGIVPILAHAERIVTFQKKPQIVEKLVTMGALVQVNAPSITGKAGRSEKKCAEWLLKKRLVHFVASDAHSLTGRPPILSEAIKRAAGIIGEEEAKALVCRNPERIIKGLDIN